MLAMFAQATRGAIWLPIPSHDVEFSSACPARWWPCILTLCRSSRDTTRREWRKSSIFVVLGKLLGDMDKSYSCTILLEHEGSYAGGTDGSACRCQRHSRWIVEEFVYFPQKLAGQSQEIGLHAFNWVFLHCCEV